MAANSAFSDRRESRFHRFLVTWERLQALILTPLCSWLVFEVNRDLTQAILFLVAGAIMIVLSWVTPITVAMRRTDFQNWQRLPLTFWIPRIPFHILALWFALTGIVLAANGSLVLGPAIALVWHLAIALAIELAILSLNWIEG